MQYILTEAEYNELVSAKQVLKLLTSLLILSYYGSTL